MSNSNTRRRKAKKRNLERTRLLRMWSKLELNSRFPRHVTLWTSLPTPGKSWTRAAWEDVARTATRKLAQLDLVILDEAHILNKDTGKFE